MKQPTGLNDDNDSMMLNVTNIYKQITETSLVNESTGCQHTTETGELALSSAQLIFPELVQAPDLCENHCLPAQDLRS